MAVFLPGALVADIRGKLADVVFSRGQGGPTVRSVGTWEQPDTDAQLACRSLLASLSTAWSNELSDAQRLAWRTYAHVYPRPNRWGRPTQKNGYLAFIQVNARAYRDSEALVFPDAPTAAPLPLATPQITVQRAGALTIAGALSPDVTGTYLPLGIYNGRPYWQQSAPPSDWAIWFYDDWWRLTAAVGVGAAPRWISRTLTDATWTPVAPATGYASSTWSYDASLAAIACPPADYPDPPAGLTLYLHTGTPLNAGREFYSGPWSHWLTLSPPDPATTQLIRCPWTWPTRATEPQYTWPGDGTGTARAYVVAQDADSGAISTQRILTPEFGNVEP